MKKTLLKIATIITLITWFSITNASSVSNQNFFKSLDQKDSNWCYKEISMIANFTYKNLDSIYKLNPKFELWAWLMKEHTTSILVDWLPWKNQVVWRAYYQENKITIDCDYYNTLLETQILKTNHDIKYKGRREILEKVSKVIAHEYYHLLSHKMNDSKWWIYPKRNERPWNIEMMEKTIYTNDKHHCRMNECMSLNDSKKIEETIIRMKGSSSYSEDNEEVQADLFWEYFFYKTEQWRKVLLILEFLDTARFITYNPMYWPIDIKQIIRNTGYDFIICKSIIFFFISIY